MRFFRSNNTIFNDSEDPPACCFIMIAYLSYFVQFLILIALMTYGYSKDLGDVGFNQVGDYAVAAFVASFVFIMFANAVILSKTNNGFVTIAWLIISILTVSYHLAPFSIMNEDGKKQMQNIAFKNWRVDMEYIIFESRNSCNGLSAQHDNCTNMCCDQKYKDQLDGRISLCKGLLSGSLIFNLIMILVLPLMDSFCRTCILD